MTIKRLISSLFPALLSPGSFGSAGIRRQNICGAILVVGGGFWTNAQRGIEADQPGLNLSEYSCRYYMAVNDKLMGRVNEPVNRAFSDDFSRDIKMRGELVGDIGFSIATACEVANDTDLVGTGAGDNFLDELTDTQRRDGWREVDFSLSADPQISVA